MDAEPAIRLVEEACRGREWALVGIGGFGCAGKTTLARALPGAAIVSTDEFWNGSRFELERVRDEVLEPLSRGATARFRSFDWAAQTTRGERSVNPAGLVVIEGVCALHRMLRDAYAVRLWVETPRAVRLARAVHRDGEAARATWEERWMLSEESYAAADDPIACADLVVNGG